MFLREASILLAAVTVGLAGSTAWDQAAAQSLPPAEAHPSSSLQDGYYLENLRKSGQNAPAQSRAPANMPAAGGNAASGNIESPAPLPGAAAQAQPQIQSQSPAAARPQMTGTATDNRYLPQPSIIAPEPHAEPQIVSRPPGFSVSEDTDDADDAPRAPSGSAGLRPPGNVNSAAPVYGYPDPYGNADTPGQTTAQPAGQPAGHVPQAPTNLAALPPEEQPEQEPKELPIQFRRQIVEYQTKEAPGTIIIDTPSTFLYYVLGDGKAVRYGIGVGRDGFTWAGVERVSRKAEWPDWNPPSEMIQRQPYLPRFMAGGPGNPMGARALYLGQTIYRVHGTNQPSTIGTYVSSGCIRMLNDDVEDLYERVKVGSKVIVRAGAQPSTASAMPLKPVAPALPAPSAMPGASAVPGTAPATPPAPVTR